jgi:hypothetical protein
MQLLSILGLVLIAQSTSWYHGKVRIYMDKPLGHWIVSASGRVHLVIQSTWDNQNLYHDTRSHSLIFFAIDGYLVLVDERGNIRSKIPVDDIGRVRNCFVRGGLAVFDKGIRSTGQWKPGLGIVQWLKKSRAVCCIDLHRARQRWRAPELEIGCPIFLGAKKLVTIGADNYKDVLVREHPPLISVRIVSTRTGHIKQRYKLPIGTSEAQLVFQAIALGTNTYSPKVMNPSRHHVTITNLVGKARPSSDIERWNKAAIIVPANVD